MGLYPRLELSDCLRAAKANYPPSTERAHYYLTMSHRSRRAINTFENKHHAREQGVNHVIELIPPEMKRGSMADLPQTMLIWKGLRLLACVKESKDITNGME